MEKNEDNYLDKLYEAYHYSISQFDKNLLYISSGALAISFSFIEKIVPLATATNKCILIWSWVIMGFTILLSLIAHFVSFRFLSKFIKLYSKDEREVEKTRKRLNKWLSFLNIALMVSLCTGIFLLILFVSKNIY